MMGTNRWVLVAVAILAGGILTQANRASAALIVQEPVPGQKVTVNTDAGLSWYWDMAGFINMTYDQQIAAIGGLNVGGGFAGLTGWHMTSSAEMSTLIFAMDPSTSLPFNPTAVGTDHTLWQGRVDDVHPNPASHWVYYEDHYTGGSRASGWYGIADATSGPLVSAWIVTDSIPAPVPLPGAALLVVLGVGVTGWLRRRRTL